MTTKTKVTHTPGEWEAHAEVRLSGEEYASVYANDAPTGYKMPAECPGPNAEANASLIAAAVNSYDKHCGERAVECAENDLLGQLLEALRAIAEVGGNLPDDTLTEKTGANDARHRGLMVVEARRIARAAIAAAE